MEYKNPLTKSTRHKSHNFHETPPYSASKLDVFKLKAEPSFLNSLRFGFCATRKHLLYLSIIKNDSKPCVPSKHRSLKHC